jgi:hypothetical protein
VTASAELEGHRQSTAAKAVAQHENYTHFLVGKEFILTARAWEHGEHRGFTIVGRFMCMSGWDVEDATNAIETFFPDLDTEIIAKMIAQRELRVFERPDNEPVG